jgi:hypothetical protein
VEKPRGTDYYESSRALGELFRAIKLANMTEISLENAIAEPSKDPITIALEPYIQHQCGLDVVDISSCIPTRNVLYLLRTLYVRQCNPG